MDTVTSPTTAPAGTAWSGPLPEVPARPARNTPGRIGLGFAIAGLVVGLIPFACFFAWFLALPALVLGIVGVTRKQRSRRAAAWAIGLAIAGWVASLAMSWVTFAVFGTVSFSTSV